MNRGALALGVMKHLGPAWCWKRAILAAKRKSGWLARNMPVFDWPALPDALAADFPADSGALAKLVKGSWPALLGEKLEGASFPFSKWDGLPGESDPFAESQRMEDGWQSLFSGRERQVGWPPRWFDDPIHHVTWPSDRPWHRIPDFGRSDVKAVWETSRFTFAGPLVRAWVRKPESRWAELFWTAVEDWAAHNPPNQGPHWKCGQECSLRLFQWVLGFRFFLHDPATTDDRVALMLRMVSATARRVEGFISFALSQDNNHGISEAVGLLTAGAMFPGLKDAARWCRAGMGHLEAQCRALIAEDGSFSQHSSNYHRVLLHDLVWASSVARAAGIPLPSIVTARAAAATRFLALLTEGATGRVLRYGADDGACVFRLSGRPYEDFRPVIAAASAAFDLPSPFTSGPWEEESLLLTGRVPDDATGPPAPREILERGPGGLCVVRRGRLSALFRTPGHFRHRPGHADHLHVSIFRDGEPVLDDPGTYSYNAEPPLGTGLKEAMFHNVPMLEGRNPMDHAGRFLWLPWTSCRSWPEQSAGEVTILQSGHAGYRRSTPAAWTDRAIILRGEQLWIVDRIIGEEEVTAVIRWHARTSCALGTISCSILKGAGNEEIFPGNEATGEGIFSDRYLECAPGWCRKVTAVGRQILVLSTWTPPGAAILPPPPLAYSFEPNTPPVSFPPQP